MTAARFIVLAVFLSPFTRASPLTGPTGNFSYNEDFSEFGQQQNQSCPALGGGICAAASAINSFIFLENEYPTIYGNSLTPNSQGPRGSETDPDDTMTFANAYYSLPLLDPGGDPFDNFVAVKMAWFSTYAPGTTYIESAYPGSPNNNGTPTVEFLASQIQQREDVELFVYGGGIGHAITLNGITCTPTSCVIKYQDPNTPGEQQTSQLFDGPAGLIFQGLPGSSPTYTQTFFTIEAAFSESPIPEPACWILLGTGLVALIFFRTRRDTIV